MGFDDLDHKCISASVELSRNQGLYLSCWLCPLTAQQGQQSGFCRNMGTFAALLSNNLTEARRYGERTVDLICSFTNTIAMTSGRRPDRGSIISVLAILK
jgi:hypothetical protein